MGVIQTLKGLFSSEPDEREVYRCELCGSEFEQTRQTCPECGSDVEKEVVSA